MEIDDELIYGGGGYQYHVSPRLAVEGSFFFSPASLEVEDMVGIDNDDDEDGVDDDENNGDDGDADNGEDDDDDDDDDDVGVSASYVTGSLVYYFREAGRILPFVMAGGGVATLDIDGADTPTKVTGVFGGGVLFAVTERWLLRADVRNHVYSADGATQPAGGSATVTDLSLTGGVAWRF